MAPGSGVQHKKKSLENDTPFPSSIRGINNTDSLSVDGHECHLHWESETCIKTEDSVVAFDLASDTFHVMHLPNPILDSSHGAHLLGVLGGRICVTSWHNDGSLVVWVMRQYGMSESWVKILVFSQSKSKLSGSGIASVYGFTLCRDLLFEDKVGHLVLYDLVADKFKPTRAPQYAFAVVKYIDNLAFIPPII